MAGTGTYIAPAVSTPSIATTESADRGSSTATGSSGPTPDAISNRANRFTRALSSANDNTTSPHTKAVSADATNSGTN